jgi:hypothetical protein
MPMMEELSKEYSEKPSRKAEEGQKSESPASEIKCLNQCQHEWHQSHERGHTQN